MAETAMNLRIWKDLAELEGLGVISRFDDAV
jgi:hypothetical protein